MLSDGASSGGMDGNAVIVGRTGDAWMHLLHRSLRASLPRVAGYQLRGGVTCCSFWLASAAPPVLSLSDTWCMQGSDRGYRLKADN